MWLENFLPLHKNRFEVFTLLSHSKNYRPYNYSHLILTFSRYITDKNSIFQKLAHYIMVVIVKCWDQFARDDFLLFPFGNLKLRVYFDLVCFYNAYRKKRVLLVLVICIRKVKSNSLQTRPREMNDEVQQLE